VANNRSLKGDVRESFVSRCFDPVSPPVVEDLSVSLFFFLVAHSSYSIVRFAVEGLTVGRL
jgi:hypothetical protein